MNLLPDFDAFLLNAGLGDHSRRSYVSTMRGYLANGGPDDTAAISAYLSERLKTATVGSSAAWRAAFKHWGVFRAFAPDSIQVTKSRRKPATSRTSLDVEELGAFRASVDLLEHADVRCLLRLLPLTGQRIHEICKLKVSEYIVRNKVPGLLFYGKHNTERFVALSAGAVALLDAHIQATSPTLWIFPALLDRTTPMRADTVRKLLRQVRANDTVTPHVLRHTFASRSLDKGANLAEVQRLLGHQDIATTAKYLHPSDQALQKVVNRLDDED